MALVIYTWRVLKSSLASPERVAITWPNVTRVMIVTRPGHATARFFQAFTNQPGLVPFYIRVNRSPGPVRLAGHLPRWR
jgi:hypothetical protein